MSEVQSEVQNNKVAAIKPRIEIRYCSLCRWVLRATWMTQEILFTFSEEVKEVALMPGFKGVYEIWLNDECIWDRAKEGRFPEAKEIKQRIRDRIAPEMYLGHSDKK